MTKSKSMLVGVLAAACVVGGGSMLGGCSTAPKTAEGRANLKSEAASALADAKRKDVTVGVILDHAAGYAVFPTVGKGGALVGGAYGKGVLYESGGVVGFCDLTQASIGLQLGGQAYTEIISFETREALQRFKDGNFAFAAQATAVALTAGAGANADYDNGVLVFTMGEAGLMYEASIGGQKFSYRAE
ncbi:MAG: lipid-binding SYLF domain-containing protein [Phycisphaerales bacterium]|nr:lipid-binding SYLF domain-containing protein [Phycisphaerales bacterium]